MITPPETRFFAALAAALSARPGAAAGVANLARAAANGDPAAIAETQRALAALSEADRDAVLAETHRRLRALRDGETDSETDAAADAAIEASLDQIAALEAELDRLDRELDAATNPKDFD